MRVYNSSRLDTDRLKVLLAFAAKGIKHSNVVVDVVETTTHFRGWAERDIGGGVRRITTAYPKSTDALIRLFIPKNPIPLTPWTTCKRIKAMYPNGLPPFETEEDAIINMAAHEFRHIWQFRSARKRRGKGEYDAEKHAYKKLNDWREHTGRKRHDPVKQANPFPRLLPPQKLDDATRAKAISRGIAILNAHRILAEPDQEVFDMLARAIGHRAENDPNRDRPVFCQRY